jgi:hypothetical protein
MVVKMLFKQLIDNKIEKQLNDIEQRKKLFSEQFAVAFYRKATIRAAHAKHFVGNKKRSSVMVPGTVAFQAGNNTT